MQWSPELIEKEDDIIANLRILMLLQSKYLYYSETLNNEYIERIHQMSYSSLSDI